MKKSYFTIFFVHRYSLKANKLLLDLILIFVFFFKEKFYNESTSSRRFFYWQNTFTTQCIVDEIFSSTGSVQKVLYCFLVNTKIMVSSFS